MLPAVTYLDSIRKQFAYYRQLGERTLAQLDDEQLYWSPGPESNSIAVIIKHLHGNMLSRWTDFLTTDGEKDFRNREKEFEDPPRERPGLLALWRAGWTALETALAPLTNNDLQRTVYIRQQGHTVREAINRQLAHYPYHIGQIVYLGRMQRGEQWQSLSIPRGESAAFNARSAAAGQRREHYTDQWLTNDDH